MCSWSLGGPGGGSVNDFLCFLCLVGMAGLVQFALVALGCMLDSALLAGTLGSFCLAPNPLIAKSILVITVAVMLVGKVPCIPAANSSTHAIRVVLSRVKAHRLRG